MAKVVMKTVVAGALAVLAVVGCLAVFASGPVGPESILHKDATVLVEGAAASANTHVSGPSAIEVESVPVTGKVEAKRRLKLVLSAIGVLYPVSETAEQFSFGNGKLSSPVRCFIRLRGDHVLSIALDQSAPAELVQAIRSRFPGYTIHQVGS